MTAFGNAVREAGWTPEIIGKATGIAPADVDQYLKNGKPLPHATGVKLNAWFEQRVGRGSDGLLYVDPYRPMQTMNAIDHPVVHATWRGTGGDRVA